MAELDNLLKKYKFMAPELVSVVFGSTKVASTSLDKGAKTKMEKAFDGCWANRSSPLMKMPRSASSAYCRMESTKVGKLHLILNSSHDKKKVSMPTNGVSKYSDL